MDALPAGIRRITIPLPSRPGHVNAYLVPGPEGATLVDTGIGLPDVSDWWAHELEGAGRVARIFVTHFHPDHVGAAADLRDLTGAPVLQGALDLAQCRLVWGPGAHDEHLVGWFQRAGVPEAVTRELVEQGSAWRAFTRFADDATPVEAGALVDGWEVIAAPGHADGQLMLLREGVLIGGDHVLDPISPAVGLWPDSRPDPLGDYLDALRLVVELDPAIVLPGHGDPIHDPAGRARALVEHHRQRLEVTASALAEGPLTAYDVSFPLFGAALPPGARRFAVAETLSHLERLVLEGGARRGEAAGVVTYTSA